MKKSAVLSTAFLFASLFSAQAHAAQLAVIDSGLDVKHPALKQHIWVNAAEVVGDEKDEDGNGYVDDINGWNFAENSNKLLDEKFLGTFSSDVYTYFDVQGRVVRGVATESDKEWIRSKKGDAAFIKQLMRFGNFVHGTHVTGIGVKGTNSQAMGLKIIPTDKPGLSQVLADVAPRLQRDASGVAISSPFNDMIVQFMLQLLVTQQSKALDKTFQYASDKGADVANCSFGTSSAAIKKVLQALLKSVLGRDASEEELNKHTKFFINTFVAGTQKSLSNAPGTLFVFAAGNDGANNDESPTAPANVRADNAITVAATLEGTQLASFSNYGVASVDVAAPGVMITSSIPGNGSIALSGTSQAAPRVANVAVKVKEANPRLTPGQIKEIIIKTVDKKEFLRGKVASGGVVNEQRAVAAARASTALSLAAAINQARSSVFDMALFSSDYSFQRVVNQGAVFVQPLPSLFPEVGE